MNRAKADRRDLSLKRVVDAIRPGAARALVWDVARVGLGIDVWPSGKRTWVYQYKTAAGVQRRMKLGDASVMTPAQADAAFHRAASAVHAGGDPLDVQRRARLSRALDAGAPTVRTVAARYLDDLTRDASARWAAEARRIFEKNIEPALGGKLVRDLTVKDVKALHASMRDRPIAANRTRAVLSAVLARAIADEDRPADTPNPAALVEDYDETARDRYLTADEWPRMAKALASLRAELELVPAWDTRPAQLDALLTLFLTGARLRAVLPRTWADVDTVERVMRVSPAHKGVEEIPLGWTALAFLVAARERARAKPSHRCFPGQRREGRHRPHVSSLDGVWHELRTRAGVPDMTIHDLRRSFATLAGDCGISDHVIGGLLGHSVPGIRGRYARRTPETLLAAADLVSAEVARRLGLAVPVVFPAPRHAHEE